MSRQHAIVHAMIFCSLAIGGCGSPEAALPAEPIPPPIEIDLSLSEAGPDPKYPQFGPHLFNEHGYYRDTTRLCPYPYPWRSADRDTVDRKKLGEEVFETAMRSEDPTELNGYAACFKDTGFHEDSVLYSKERALALFTKSAHLGDPEAMGALAEIGFAANAGPSEFPTEGAAWLQKAAEAGYPPAQYCLAVFHTGSRWFEPQPEQATAWLQKAAQGDHRLAQYLLAVRHEMGDGVPRSDELAVSWMRRSAALGLGTAMSRLGDYHYAGRGVERSTSEAVAWWRKAMERSRDARKAAFNLAVLHWKGEGVPRSAREAHHLGLWSLVLGGPRSAVTQRLVALAAAEVKAEFEAEKSRD